MTGVHLALDELKLPWTVVVLLRGAGDDRLELCTGGSSGDVGCRRLFSVSRGLHRRAALFQHQLELSRVAVAPCEEERRDQVPRARVVRREFREKTPPTPKVAPHNFKQQQQQQQQQQQEQQE